MIPSERLGQFIDTLQQKTSRLVVKTSGTTKTLELVPLTQKLDRSYNAAPDAIYQAFKTLIKGHANECDKHQLETLKAIIHKKLTVVKASQSGIINWLFLLFNTILKTQLRNEKQALIQLEKTLLETLNQPQNTSRNRASKKTASAFMPNRQTTSSHSLPPPEFDLDEILLKPSSTSGSIPHSNSGAGSSPGSIPPPPPPPPPGPPPPLSSANPAPSASIICLRRNPPLPEPPSPLLAEPPHPPFLPPNRIPTEEELEAAKQYVANMRATVRCLKEHSTAIKKLEDERTKIEQIILKMGLGIDRCKNNIHRLQTETDEDFVFLEFPSQSGPFQAPVWTERAYRENFPDVPVLLSSSQKTSLSADCYEDWAHEDSADDSQASDSLNSQSINQLKRTLISQISQSQFDLDPANSSSSSSTQTQTPDAGKSESILIKRSAIFNAPFQLLVQQARLKYCLIEQEKLTPALTAAEENLKAKLEELTSLSITDINEAISLRELYIDNCEKIIKRRAMKAAAEKKKLEEQNRHTSTSSSVNETEASSNQQGDPAILTKEDLRAQKFTSFFNKLKPKQTEALAVVLRTMSNKSPDQIAENLDGTILEQANVVEPSQVVAHATPQKPTDMRSRVRALQAAMHKTAETDASDPT